MAYRIAFVIAACVAACTASDREADIARVHAHLQRVEAELAGGDTSALDSSQLHQRRLLLARLRDYTDAERYPTNDALPFRTPIFIDPNGVRCAMAYLIESTGATAFVQRIARDHNYAYIDDLADDPELQQWLTDHGISLREAARIQPSYSNFTRSRWAPTLSVDVGAAAGALIANTKSSDAFLSAGVRAGARHITYTDGPCDRCVYQSTAFVAEYRYLGVPGTGHAHQLGLLVQRDLDAQSSDHQRYLLAGALFSAGTGALGDGVGAEAGYGMSLRRRTLPLFGELVATAVTAPGGATLRVGLDVGLVW